MKRAFLFILDSVGIGGAPDADEFGDKGSNTLGHIASHMELRLPHLASLGLGHAVQAASGHMPKGFGRRGRTTVTARPATVLITSMRWRRR